MDYRQRAADLYRAATAPSSRTSDQLVEALSPAEPLVRHVAAIELAKLDPLRLPEHSIRELLDTVARDEYGEHLALDEEYGEATATEEDCKALGQQIVLAFAALHCGQADFVIPRLLEFWSFDSEFYELAFALLALAFPLTDAPVDRRSLTGVQSRILRALVKEPALWGSYGEWPDTLSEHGLPTSRDEVYRLLGYRR
jgi:hypothetical protein